MFEDMEFCFSIPSSLAGWYLPYCHHNVKDTIIIDWYTSLYHPAFNIRQKQYDGQIFLPRETRYHSNSNVWSLDKISHYVAGYDVVSYTFGYSRLKTWHMMMQRTYDVYRPSIPNPSCEERCSNDLPRNMILYSSELVEYCKEAPALHNMSGS